MGKKEGLFVIFAVVLSIFFASSASGVLPCGGDTKQVIMNLTSAKNAHGSMWDQSAGAAPAAAPTQICYNDLFTEKYGGTSDSHSATSTPVLNLSNTFNAHAGITGAAAYSPPLQQVRYAGFVYCRLQNSSKKCVSGDNEAAVVYLSDKVNAHLSKTKGNYGWVVCCKGIYGRLKGVGVPSQNFCEEFVSRGECENHTAMGAYDPLCPTGKVCSCYWDETACIPMYEGSLDGCNYKCLIKSSNYHTAVCDESNLKIVTSTGEIDTLCGATDEVCTQRRDTTIPCGLEAGELPFFGWWQFALSVIFMYFVYFIWKRTR